MKKLISFILALAMTASFIPVFAEDEAKEEFYSAVGESDEYYEQTIKEYEGRVIEDPQNVPDQELFGEWDIPNEEWLTEPLLNYEKYPELQEVENAAKRGNYDICKEELLKYYRRKFQSYNFSLPSYNSGPRYETARLLVENIYGGTAMGIVSVGEEETETSLNIKPYISSGTNVFSVQLVSIKKDGYKAVFDSREGENRPYLSIEVNGRENIYYPSADATISPINNGKTSFGKQNTIEVEESYTSIGFTKDRIDDYTKRGYIKFNTSDINEGDIIGSATLHLSGHIEESENPKKAPFDRSIKDVAVFKGGYTGWNENITWNSMMSDTLDLDIRTFDGENTISISTLTQARHLSALAYAYNGTGNEVFLFHHIRHLVERLNNKGGLPTFDTETVLANGLALRDMISQFTALTESKYMTPEYFTMILKYFYMMTDWNIHNWDVQYADHNNFGTASAAGLIISAVAFCEFKVVDDPICENCDCGKGRCGGWAAVAKHRIQYVAEKDVFADSAGIEVSFNYNKFILDIFSTAISNLKAMNVDFAEYVGEDVWSKIERLLRYLVYGTTPRFGGWQQGHSTDYTADIAASLANYLEHLDDPMYKWAYTKRKEGEEPKRNPSVAFDISKKVVMRSDWGEDAVTAHINADGGHNLSHGQNDDLGLNIYAYGDYVLPQSTHKDYNYKTPVTAWLLSSKKVNSIEVNNVTQKGAYGADLEVLGERILASAGGVPGDMHPELREFNGIYNFQRTETYNYQDHEYLSEDFKLFRDVLFIEPEYFIVTDYVEPINDKSRLNTYKQYWHMLPHANISLDPETNNVRTNFETGPNIVIAPVEQRLPITGNIKTGYWAEGSNFRNAKYARYDKEASGATTFNTVLYPMRPQDDIDVVTENIVLNLDDDKANAFSLKKIDKKSGQSVNASYYTLFDSDLKKSRAFGDYTTDGMLAFIQKGEADKNDIAIVRRGSELFDKADDKYIIKSNSEISDIGVKWQGDEIVVETSKSVVTKAEAEAAKSKNLALGKNAFASNGTTDAALATDGDIETSWQSDTKTELPVLSQMPYMYVDMEEDTTVTTAIIKDIKDPEASLEDEMARGEKVPQGRELREEDKINNYYIFWSDDAKKWEYIGRTDYTLLEDGSYENRFDFPGAVTARYFKAVSTRGDNPAICEFELYEANDECVILDDITFAADKKIKKLIVNGEEVSFKQNPGNLYVYTGDTPIIPDEEKDDDDSQSGSSSGTGGSTSGSGSSSGSSSHGSSGGSSFSGGGSSGIVVPPDEPQEGEDEAYLEKYPEIKGHWGEEEIISLLKKDIIKGDRELGLNLKGNVTRAEFAALLNRALSLPASEYKDTFRDVSESDWFAKDIITANDAGLISGFDGMANPKDNITREQMAKMICDAYKLKNPDKSFDDIEEAVWQDGEEISDWARVYVNVANALSLIKGVEEGVFAPKNTVAREQAFAVIGRLLK